MAKEERKTIKPDDGSTDLRSTDLPCCVKNGSTDLAATEAGADEGSGEAE